MSIIEYASALVRAGSQSATRVAAVLLLLLASQMAFALPEDGLSVNINEANVEELAAALDGVGQARAQAIVDYRTENGDFLIVEDLLAIRGIGEAVLEANRERIVLAD